MLSFPLFRLARELVNYGWPINRVGTNRSTRLSFSSLFVSNEASVSPGESEFFETNRFEQSRTRTKDFREIVIEAIGLKLRNFTQASLSRRQVVN